MAPSSKNAKLEALKRSDGGTAAVDLAMEPGVNIWFLQRNPMPMLLNVPKQLYNSYPVRLEAI